MSTIFLISVAVAGFSIGPVILLENSIGLSGAMWLTLFASIVGGCVSLSGFLMPVAVRINFSLVLASLFLAIAAAEFTVASSSYVRWWLFIQARNEDWRSKERVVVDLRADGIEAVSAIAPKYIEPFILDGSLTTPLSGIANRTSVLCYEKEGWTVYDSDRFGFRNVDHLWDEPTLDAVVVGDSFANGSCVPRNIVDFLREKAPLMVNLAMHGNGPLRNLATLSEYLPRLSTKRVLWFHFSGNDMADLEALELPNPNLPRYLMPGYRQNIPDRKTKIDKVLMKRHESFLSDVLSKNAVKRAKTETPPMTRVIDFLLLRNLRTALNLDLLGRPRTPQGRWQKKRVTETTMNTFRQTMRRAREVAEQAGAKLTFIYIPDRTMLDDRSGDMDPVRKGVLNAVGEQNISIIDLYPSLVERDFTTYYNHPLWHFNSRGTKVVAKLVEAGLEP